MGISPAKIIYLSLVLGVSIIIIYNFGLSKVNNFQVMVVSYHHISRF
jgi:hypothetical protein